ncbi:MAG: YqiA/YcfP family alpha/beta fold hydrolase [Actinophytocola sp.]|uniref:alpha/beta hydrolase family protein n=1 Tax=Actinophytocola sp. TaxID=1872138 RepID=UPI003C73E4FF
MTITGVAAGVPYTALPPDGAGPAPLVLTWHMLDAPRTDAAFAAALPMTGVPAWRVHLGLPMCGTRMVDGSMTAVVDLARQDTLRAFGDGLTGRAVAEFPSALAALRSTFPITDAPPGIVGASLGGLVALRVLVGDIPVAAAALVNPAIRARSLVDLIDTNLGRTYRWDPDTTALADSLDFVARAKELRTPLLVVTGQDDHPAFHEDARALAERAPHAELVSVPGLAHPLADEPGMAPAPQRPTTTLVDDALTDWFTRHLAP